MDLASLGWAQNVKEASPSVRFTSQPKNIVMPGYNYGNTYGHVYVNFQIHVCGHAFGYVDS